MDPASILALLTGLTQLAQTVGNMVTEAKGDLSSEEEAALQAKVAELRAANDAAYDAVQAKLARAAQQ